MPLTSARLRTWILVLAGGLVAAIVAFLLYGRWQGRRFGREIPDSLGQAVQQSTKGFTYSESKGGHTLYTLHASKAVQYKSGGHLELHDVSITLYSAQGSPDNRIYGSDFDWDPVHGIARALGEVQIDFQGGGHGAGQNGASTSSSAEEGESRSTVHLKTSGLSFDKQTGVATTTEKIEFRLAEAAGSAIGASFDSQTGVVILTSDVAFNSSIGGSPLSVKARHAEFNRDSRLLYLLQDVTDYGDSHSVSDEATVSFRSDGSAYQVEAQGKVQLTGTDGQQITTRKLHIDLGPTSEPQRAVVDGGLLYVSDSSARLLHGSASAGTLLFGPKFTLHHAELRDAVSLVDQEKLPPASPSKSQPNPPVSTTRELGATKVNIDFVTDQDKQPQAEHILAEGNASVHVHQLFAKTPPEDTTIKGDQLFATLSDGDTLESVRGTGHTSLVEVKPNGQKQTSNGDHLLINFAPSAPKKTPQPKGKSAEARPATQIESAVQVGNVTLIQEGGPAGSDAGKQAAAPAVTTATADRAAYDAASEKVQLLGNPRIRSDSGEMSAAVIEIERETGDATVTGGVKATYHQAKAKPSAAFTGTGPVHVIADHAHLERKTGRNIFYGKEGELARLWQGNDSIAAPVLEMSGNRGAGQSSAQAKDNGTLEAHGAAMEAGAVNAVFSSQGEHAARAKGNVPGGQPSVVRLRSRTFNYSEAEQKAVFSGAVMADTTSGQLHANTMDVFFAPPPPAPKAKALAEQGSRVSKIVARGAVQLQQPGRKGTGDELTYTSEDEKFVLTGTPSVAPVLSDQVRGTVTGAALIFNDRDDSVVVSGGDAKAVTQTRVAK